MGQSAIMTIIVIILFTTGLVLTKLTWTVLDLELDFFDLDLGLETLSSY